MSSSDGEAQSPELGAGSPKSPVTPIRKPDDSGEEVEREEVESELESEEESEEKVQTKKKRTRVKDTREWDFIARSTFAFPGATQAAPTQHRRIAAAPQLCGRHIAIATPRLIAAAPPSKYLPPRRHRRRHTVATRPVPRRTTPAPPQFAEVSARRARSLPQQQHPAPQCISLDAWHLSRKRTRSVGAPEFTAQLQWN